MENGGNFIILPKYQNESNKSHNWRKEFISKHINEDNIEKLSRMIAYEKFLGVNYYMNELKKYSNE